MNQQDKSFMITFTTVIAVLVMLTVAIFLISRLVSMVSLEPADSSRRQATAEQRIKPAGQVRVASAAAAAQQPAAPGVAAPVAAAAPAASGQEVYTKACAACHMAGVMNAPKLGSKEAWEPRFAQGLNTLVSHAVNGIRAMPAKGGNPALTDKEIEGAIVYMLKESSIEVAAAAAPAAAPVPAAAPAPAAAPVPAAAPAAAAPAVSGQAVYTKACAACHMAGVLNAPKLGSKEAWEPRFAQGLSTLVSHAVNGIRAMPAKGGNPALTDKEIEAATVYMLKESSIEVAAAPAPAPAAAPAAPAPAPVAAPAAPAPAPVAAPAAPAPAPAAAPAAPAPAPAAAPAVQQETTQEMMNAAQQAVKAARQAAAAARQAAEAAQRALLTAERAVSSMPAAPVPAAKEPEAVPAPPPAPAVAKPVPAPAPAVKEPPPASQSQAPAPAPKQEPAPVVEKPAPAPAPAVKEPPPAPQSQAPAPAPKQEPAPVAEKPAPVSAPPPPKAAAPSEIVIPASVNLMQGQQVYNAVCLACHSTGAAGAPKLSDKAAWAPRLAQGFDTLVEHSLKGYKAMPAKGGRLDLPASSVLSAVGYMVNQVKP